MLAAKSGAADQVPAFGLVRVTGIDVTNGAFQIAKPNADSQDCFINGPTPIAIGDFGAITVDVPFMALYDTADGTPTVDSVWGAASGSYKLRSGKTGFIIKGVVDSTNGIAMVTKQGGGASVATDTKTFITDITDATFACNEDGTGGTISITFTTDTVKVVH